jgi:hypothetical protein
MCIWIIPPPLAMWLGAEISRKVWPEVKVTVKSVVKISRSSKMCQTLPALPVQIVTFPAFAPSNSSQSSLHLQSTLCIDARNDYRIVKSMIVQ